MQLPNRLRVGKTSIIGRNIPREGSDDKSLIDDDHFRNAWACTDLYLNEGAEIRFGSLLKLPQREDRSFALWTSNDGIITSPIVLSGSSFTDPLAISYLIQQKRLNPEVTISQQLESVRAGGKIKDVLRHDLHLFEVFGSDDFQDVIESLKNR